MLEADVLVWYIVKGVVLIGYFMEYVTAVLQPQTLHTFKLNKKVIKNCHGSLGYTPSVRCYLPCQK
jgi:hypothetical protein